jgi:hypothetical protein
VGVAKQPSWAAVTRDDGMVTCSRSCTQSRVTLIIELVEQALSWSCSAISSARAHVSHSL